jgi:pyrrolidone-carboxylate peptidase
MRIVVTGFGPFGDFDTNPSTVVVNSLSDEATKENCCEDLELVTRLVDVDYAQALKYSEAICADLEADVGLESG